MYLPSIVGFCMLKNNAFIISLKYQIAHSCISLSLLLLIMVIPKWSLEKSSSDGFRFELCTYYRFPRNSGDVFCFLCLSNAR